MKKVAIIGGGIVGSVAAFYLSKSAINVTLFDQSRGQATSAAVGIICPWVSQRRNKEWYQLVEKGADFYNELISDLEQDDFYSKSGALLLHQNPEKLLKLAQSRTQAQDSMGHVSILAGEALAQHLMDGVEIDQALHITGAACVDGALMVKALQEKSKSYGAEVIDKKVYLNSNLPKVIDGVEYDAVIVSSGAWINDVFKDLNFDIDVYPQKGQMIEFKNMFDVDAKHYPYIIPQGELDIMFDLRGSIIVGASHEKEKGFDLSPDSTVAQRLYEEALEYLPFLEGKEYSSRVGTRAHSSDFNPFYGPVTGLKDIYAASALGSSGLTSGPLIGYRLAQAIIHDMDVELATDMSKYMKKRD